ncbi:MAG: Eco57I restriction-modification methylase domain-containing protein [Neisseria sp.]|nr:Eco57I restriction-modification methylase domain-containing protein [Neisseria sp.]
MKKSKTLGQVLTPPWIVREILDAADYAGKGILRRYALEPSCGDGAFLCEMAARYIAAAEDAGQPSIQTAAELGEYLVGIELDIAAHRDCLANLNRLATDKLGHAVNWRVCRQNTLDVYRQYAGRFDWILGNPPYIRLHNLDEAVRERLKREFRFTVGTTDMYLAFFEMAFLMLSDVGKLGFITPNSFLHNTSYRAFRRFLQQQGKLAALYDLKSHKVFDGYSAYTAISVFDQAHAQPDFVYKELVSGGFCELNRICFDSLDNKKWVFSSEENSRFLAQMRERPHSTMRDFFHVQYGFATLRDKIFIANAKCMGKGLCEFNGETVEAAVLRPIVKGSRYQGRPEDMEAVLFPYHLVNGRYTAYGETELRQRFPLAYAYLLKHREELQKRDSDKHAQWFEFGRSQGLQTSHREKIVVSTLVNGCVQFFRLPANVLVYSGIFITQKTPQSDWRIAEQALASPEFLQYARLTGKDMSGGYKALSGNQIKQFAVSWAG